MPDIPVTFLEGFKNRGPSSEDVRATAHWATNTLYLNVPASKELEMAIAVAHVQPEESLHNEWDASIINTAAHLSLAADDALERALLTTDSPDEIDSGMLEIVNECRQSISSIFESMEPFVEAVDKFQILTVLAGDSAIEEAFRESYAEEHGEEAAEEFLDEFTNALEEDMKLVTGEKSHSGNDGSYVNPLYFHALAEIARTDWRSENESGIESEGDIQNPVGRSIAEVVARVTLDVPNPIAPLGGDDFPSFSPLDASPVDLEQKSVRQLQNDSRYSLSKDDYDDYLGIYEDEITAEDLDIGFDTVEDSWVAGAFVNVLKALEDLREDDDVIVADLDTDELRDRLVQEVHGVDPATATTMQDHPTVMFDIPRQADTDIQDVDIMSQEGAPLPKILASSFEQERPFAAAVYNLTEDDRKYELNWHIKGESYDLSQYQHVPEHAADFTDVWHHYYVWDGLRQFVPDGYIELMLGELVDEFESVDQLNDRIESIESNLNNKGAVAGEPEQSENATQGPNSGLSSTENVWGADLTLASRSSTPRDLASGGRKKDQTIRAELEKLLAEDPPRVNILLNLAKDVGLDPVGIDGSDIMCPVCDARSGTCGGDGDCHWAEERERFARNFPTILSHLE